MNLVPISKNWKLSFSYCLNSLIFGVDFSSVSFIGYLILFSSKANITFLKLSIKELQEL